MASCFQPTDDSNRDEDCYQRRADEATQIFVTLGSDQRFSVAKERGERSRQTLVCRQRRPPLRLVCLPHTHLIGSNLELPGQTIVLPVELRENVELARTNLVSRMFETWEQIPVALLQQC
jgi:hypothetical protein